MLLPPILRRPSDYRSDIHRPPQNFTHTVLQVCKSERTASLLISAQVDAQCDWAAAIGRFVPMDAEAGQNVVRPF
jgi:hypothetical protein